MTTKAQWIKNLKDELAELRAHHLEPLEGGWVRLYRRGYGGKSEDITEEQITSLRKSIDNMQAIVVRCYEEPGRNA